MEQALHDIYIIYIQRMSISAVSEVERGQAAPIALTASLNSLSDEELFVLIRQSGDQSAFNLLYKRYDKRLYAYCLRATGGQMNSHDAAKDAFQAVMSAVFEKRATFVGGNYAAWLFTIARHHILKFGRTAGRTRSLDESPALLETVSEDAFGNSASDPSERDFLLQQSINQAVERLPDDLREAFDLKFRQELSHDEIATQLGISLSLAKVRVFRAKQQLRTMLAGVWERETADE
jgi:RNA polymerase sigma-70 factor, ECF subfamily